MSKQEVKAFEEKLNLVEKTFEGITENNARISKLDGAIACLREERNDACEPDIPNYQRIFEKKIKKLTDEYDEKHRPKDNYMPEGIGWWLLFLTLPFIIACYSFFVEKGATIGKDVMIFFVAFAIGAVIPVVVFLVSLYLIITHKARVKHYIKRNRKRLKEMEAYKSEAEKEVHKARAGYEKKCAQYQKELAQDREIDEKIERYRRQKAELSKTVKDDTAVLKALFDELQTPEEYRSPPFLTAMKIYFHADEKAIETGKMTALESLQEAYKAFRKTEEDAEIDQLANRHAARQEEKIRKLRAEHLAEINARREAEREKAERERREREEAEKIKRWNELDKWAEEVNAQ